MTNINRAIVAKEQNYLKLQTKYAQILGEFQGTLEGILWWDIPEELKEKLKLKIKELEDEKLA